MPTMSKCDDDHEQSTGEHHNKYRKYPIPAHQCLFPAHINPFMNDKQKMADIMDWWYGYSMLPKEHYWSKVSQAMSTYTYCFYPFTKSMDRYENIVKWVGYVFVWDDHNDTPQGEFGENLSDAIPVHRQYLEAVERLQSMYVPDGESRDKPFIGMSGWRPYVLCVYAVVETVLNAMNRAQRRRFLASWRLYLNGQHRENELVMNSESLDFDGVTKLRMATGSMDTFISLIEYSVEVCVPDGDWDDPRVRQLRDLCNKSVVFMNDVYSFEKELRDQNGCVEGLVTNSVAYYVVREGMAIPEAISKMIGINGDIEREFKAISDDVYSDDDISADTKVFVRALTAMMPGNIVLSQTLLRYNKIY
ncbi:unnamed protein product [Oppiella nova]|uniref:Terpene synthase n=1 Tax=Oppiella nova TaxID=334625 RepID=A0A7R9QRF3_9ACAR|nr:unnamed protein product [Oppiella nova]CAG2171173.1 unnamed protein product [Oppiella nova]